MLLLTSYERMRRYLANADGTALTDTVYRKNVIVNMITAASKQIEKFLNRTLDIAAYTEYFDVNNDNEIEFFVKASPITTLSSVYEDVEGLFDGGESEITDCYIGVKENSFILPVPCSFVGRKVLRAIYTGGIAYHGTQSLFTVGTITGTWNVNSFCKGSSSEAVGIVKAVTATTLTIENQYGIFTAGETLTEYTDEACTTSDATAVLTTITRQSLAESYPDIARAAEMQVRYMFKHKDDYELSSTSKDGTNTRRESVISGDSGLTKESTLILMQYRKLNS